MFATLHRSRIDALESKMLYAGLTLFLIMFIYLFAATNKLSIQRPCPRMIDAHAISATANW